MSRQTKTHSVSQSANPFKAPSNLFSFWYFSFSIKYHHNTVSNFIALQKKINRRRGGKKTHIFLIFIEFDWLTVWFYYFCDPNCHSNIPYKIYTEKEQSRAFNEGIAIDVWFAIFCIQSSRTNKWTNDERLFS